MKIFNRHIKNFLAPVIMLVFMSSCTDYLNVIPDNVAEIDDAFETRHEAENYMWGCYSYIPGMPYIADNPALVGGDEVWLIPSIAEGNRNIRLWEIALGGQGSNNPLANYWSSGNGGKNLWRGIRDCNIFLDNIHKPFNLDETEKKQWIAEVKFLKAYLHFYLLRMYGPIPIMRENIEVSAGIEEVQSYREPVEEVFEYIVELLDEAIPDLLPKITDPTLDYGRATKSIAMAMKGKVLLYAASPLFNGNPDYMGFQDKRGIPLFPQEYDKTKWEKAAVALRDAIDAAHEAGFELFDFSTNLYAKNLSDSTILAMGVRGAVTERAPVNNREVIWAATNNNPRELQGLCQPFFTAANAGRWDVCATYAPTFRVVEQFYSKNGVPIDEDIEWNGVDPYGFRTSTEDDRYYIQPSFKTVNLHFNREPRFYGSISFDGGTFYGNGRFTDDEDLLHTKFQLGEIPGGYIFDKRSSTGYLVKKLINYQTSVGASSYNLSDMKYAFPMIRLADLYLMYAEALNEAKDQPDAEVYDYIDQVRERSGLDGVVNSWQNFSTIPDKPRSKEGMRSIIHRERMNELAFEGVRFWDLRRWKLTEDYMNQPVYGWSTQGEEAEDFYKKQLLYELQFETKDYLWPLKIDDLLKNSNLVQNPGW
ncbi:RagB/SusD family nutrient uptake outer membrane protein [Puteibacter caeruleilacunae]|nr:RagB/SusD family nutrient uptake outer membrane protein [Puteibacter caeruleilacunae]